MNRSLFLIVIAIVVSAVGCGDDPQPGEISTNNGAAANSVNNSSSNNAASCQDACGARGATRCGEAGVIESCESAPDGCLGWLTTRTCQRGQRCEDTALGAQCVAACAHPCADEGATRCGADGAVQTCADEGSGCLAWSSSAPCGAGLRCGAQDGVAACVCDDACPTEGATRCVDNGVERCDAGASGCLAWVVDEACGAHRRCETHGGVAACACQDACDAEGTELCDAESNILSCERDADGCLFLSPAGACGERQRCLAPDGEAACVCDDACEGAGDRRCGRGDASPGIYTCAEDADGCFYATLDVACPDQRCVEAFGEPSCIEIASCDAPRLMQDGDTFRGDDIRLYGSTHLYTNLSCNASLDVPGAPEVVLRVELARSATLVVREMGGLNAVIKIQGGMCDSNAPCEIAEDLGFDESEGIRYTAPEAGTYIVLVGAWSNTFAGPNQAADFDIAVEISPPEDCGNGADDNLDARIDCDDPACYGRGACIIEVNCEDGEDNDLDEVSDCGDEDCADIPGCDPAYGVYEFLRNVDLGHHTLMIDLDPLDAPTWASSPSSALPVEPGSGDAGTLVLDLGDDDAEAVALLTPLELLGVTTSVIYVSSNGFLTLDVADPFTDGAIDTFFEYARVAPLDTDLDPTAHGVITVDQLSDGRVAVTWFEVPTFDTDAWNTFQAVLWPDGRVELSWLDLDPDLNFGIYAGVGDGDRAGNGRYPRASNLIP